MGKEISKTREVPLFRDVARKLAENRWVPIPIEPGTKRCLMEGWSRFNEAPPTELDLRRMISSYSNHYTGFCIPKRTVVLDADLLDESIARRARKIMERLFGMTPLVRIGEAPKFALFYRTDGDIKSERLGRFGLPLEIFSGTGQVLAYAVHPDTACGYEWESLHPLKISADSEMIPAISQQQIDALVLSLANELGIDKLPPGSMRRAEKSNVEFDRRATWRDGLLGRAFFHAGMAAFPRGNDRIVLKHCPWVHEHTGGKMISRSGSVVFAPAQGSSLGAFHCSHNTCSGRTYKDAIGWLRENAPEALTKAEAELPPERRIPPPVDADAVSAPVAKIGDVEAGAADSSPLEDLPRERANYFDPNPEWPDPVLSQETGAGRATLPFDVFPNYLLSRLEDVAQNTEVPSDYLSLMGMAVGSIYSSLWNIWVQSGDSSFPAGNYYLFLGRSGSGKTKAYNQIIRPAIDEIRRQRVSALGSEDQFDILRSRRDSLRVKLAKESKSFDRVQREYEEAKAAFERAAALNPHFAISSATPESLGRDLADSAMVLATSEAHEVVRTLFGLQYGGRDAKLSAQSFIDAWDGSNTVVRRANTESQYRIYNPRLSIILGAQDSLLTKLAEASGEILERGVFPRFLVCAPDSPPDYAAHEIHSGDLPKASAHALSEGFARLNERIEPVILSAGYDVGRIRRLDFKFSPEAWDCVSDYRLSVRREQAPGCSLANAADIAGKLGVHLVRLSASLHLLWSGESDFDPSVTIDVKMVEMARSWLDAVTTHMIYAVGRAQTEPAWNEALRTAEWMAGDKEKERSPYRTFSPRDIMRNVVRHVPDSFRTRYSLSDWIRVVVDMMLEAGLCRPVDENSARAWHSRRKGGRVRFELNPKVILYYGK